MKITIRVSILTILLCMVFTQVAFAQDVSDTPGPDIISTNEQQTVGVLAGVYEHTQVPTRYDGRRLYSVTMESRGETITIDLWMLPTEALTLLAHVGTTGILSYAPYGDGTCLFTGYQILNQYMEPKPNDPPVPPDY